MSTTMTATTTASTAASPANATADHALEPVIPSRSLQLPCEALVIISQCLFRSRAYGSFASMSRVSSFYQEALRMEMRRFVVSGLQGGQLDTFMAGWFANQIRHVILSDQEFDQRAAALKWQRQQESRDDGSRILTSITYWHDHTLYPSASFDHNENPSTPLKSTELDTAITSSIDTSHDEFRALMKSPELWLDVFSENLHGKGSDLFDLDQAVDIVLGLPVTGSGILVTTAHVRPMWNMLDEHSLAPPSLATLPSVDLVHCDWALELGDTGLGRPPVLEWAGNLAFAFLGSLALTCETSSPKSLVSWLGSWEMYDRPRLSLYGIPSLHAAEAIFVKIAEVYRLRSSAVKVSIFIEVVLPPASSLPTPKRIYRVVNQLNEPMADAIQSQDMWDESVSKFRPEVLFEIGVRGDAAHRLLVILEIDYRIPIEEGHSPGPQEYASTKNVAPPERVIQTRIYLREAIVGVLVNEDVGDDDNDTNGDDDNEQEDEGLLLDTRNYTYSG